MPKINWLAAKFDKNGNRKTSVLKLSNFECDEVSKTITINFVTIDENPNINPLVSLISSALPSPEHFLIHVTNMGGEHKSHLSILVSPTHENGINPDQFDTIQAMIKREIARNLKANSNKKIAVQSAQIPTPA